MAFPQIADADTKSGTVAANSTSWTLTYPTNIAANDLLLALVASDGIPTLSATGWGAFARSAAGAAIELGISWLVAVGTETGTFTLTLGATEQGAWRIFRIPAAGWFGGTLPGGSIPTHTDSVSQVESADGTDSAPNPISLDPSSWGVEDTLWIAAVAIDTSRTISGYPSNMPDRHTADVSGGSTGATLAIATAESAAGSFDPAAFASSASDDWTAVTIAVRPAAAAAAVPAHGWYAGGW